MSKIQGKGVKNSTEIVAGGGTIADLPTDDQIYISANTINKTLKNAIIDGDLGGMGVNTLAIFKGDEGVASWSTGDNATFLGGGTISGTFVQNSSSPLNGNYDFRYTQAAGSLNDYFASPVKTVPPKFRGNTIFLTSNYKYDGGNSDILVIIYDVTNAQIISSTTDYISLNSTIASTFISSVVIPSNCTQIRIGFHVKTLNSGKIFQFDDVVLSTDVFAGISTTNFDMVRLDGGNGFGSTNTLIRRYTNVRQNTGKGILNYADSSTLGSSFTALKKCRVFVTVTDQGTSQTVFGISKNSTQLTTNIASITASDRMTLNSIDPTTASIDYNSLAWSGDLEAGDVIRVHVGVAGSISSASALAGVSVLAIAETEAVLVPTQQFSTDTASLVYAGSGTYTLATLANAPIGTFLTFTRSASTNTRTQTNAAPTQTVSDMNANGIRVFTRAFGAADSSNSPACFAIQFGKGLKGIAATGYESTSKVNAVQLDKQIQNSNVSEYGLDVVYDEVRGILFLDAGRCSTAAITDRAFLSPQDTGTNNAPTSAYIVVNAGKTPSLVAINQPTTGDVRQIKYVETSATTAISATIPADNTIPQITEGTQVLSLTVTPKKIGNTLLVEAFINAYEDSNSGDALIMALFQDSTANAIAAMSTASGGLASGFQGGEIGVKKSVTVSSLSSTTFTVRVGMNAGTSVTLNRGQLSGGSTFTLGGTYTSWIKVTEIQA